jgi:hypothetical protein
MSERAKGHGGECLVAGADGEGTVVRWVAPLMGPPENEASPRVM